MDANRSGAIVVSWGSAVAGRERILADLFGRVLRYAGGLKQASKVEDVRVFVPKIGSFRDTLMLFGRMEALLATLVDPEFEKLIVEGTIVVHDLRVDVWEGGGPEWFGSTPDPYFVELKNLGLV